MVLTTEAEVPGKNSSC